MDDVQALNLAEDGVYEVPPPPPKLTVADLPSRLKPGKVTVLPELGWQAAQFVEPERDGLPWCTAEDAEEMLVRAARSVLRGMAGKAYSKYELTTADSIMTLKLG